jgi:hypothetical protein
MVSVRPATLGAGTDARGADGRAESAAGGWASGWVCGCAWRVTVPLRLKFESSRGPMSDAGAEAAGAAVDELSWASAGTAADSKAAASPQ